MVANTDKAIDFNFCQKHILISCETEIIDTCIEIRNNFSKTIYCKKAHQFRTGMGEWLDQLTLKRVPGSKPSSDLTQKCEEKISQLSVIPGKEEKGIMRCGHTERKDKGRTARFVYLFSGPFVLSI